MSIVSNNNFLENEKFHEAEGIQSGRRCIALVSAMCMVGAGTKFVCSDKTKKQGFLAALDPLLGTGPRIGCCHGRIMASVRYHTQESNSTQLKVVLSCLA